jgi:hypothetical protein
MIPYLKKQTKSKRTKDMCQAQGPEFKTPVSSKQLKEFFLVNLV